jgi:hypothetical protein
VLKFHQLKGEDKMPIHGLTPRLSVLGHIKIGGRKKIQTPNGERTIPVKYDNFVVTTNERGELDYIPNTPLMEKLKRYENRKDGKVKRMLVWLLSDDPDENLDTSLAFYDGQGCRCRGDGREAQYIDPESGEISKLKCPCPMLRMRLGDSKVEDRAEHPFLKPDKRKNIVCKTHAVLRVMIHEAMKLGGVYLFRTTSRHSIEQLQASMALIRNLTGGALVGAPFELSVEPKRVRPENNQNYQTVYVITLTHSADAVDFLKLMAEQHRMRAEMRSQIQGSSILSLPSPGLEDRDEQLAVAQEFNDPDDPGDYIDAEAHPSNREPEHQASPQEPPTEESGPSETPQEEAPQEASQAQEEAPQGRQAATPEQREEIRRLKEEAEATKEAKDEDTRFPGVNTEAPENADERPAAKALRKRYIETGHDAGFSDEELRDWMKFLWEVESSAALKTWQTVAMIEALNKRVKEA